MTVLVPAGYTALGIVIGALIEERLWHLLSRPLPRPWRPVGRAYRDMWRDSVRLLTTGRWT